MINALTRRLNYSGVIATIALFLSLGGGAYALTLPGDSVGAREIQSDAVGAAEIRKNAVGSAELKDAALGASDLAPKSVTRAHLDFPLGEAAANADVQTGTLDLPSGTGVTTVASTRLVEREAAGRIALVHGALNVTNGADDGKPADVTVRVLHNGRAEPGSFTVTIPDGYSDTVPVVLKSEALAVGDHTFALQMQASGGSDVNLGTRSLDAASFRPIFSPPFFERFGR